MYVTLNHTIPLGSAQDTDSPEVKRIKEEYGEVRVTVRYSVTYHYDPGCHTMRNGDPGWPPSSEIDIDEAEVDEWSLDGDDGVDGEKLDDDFVQKLYDKWADNNSSDIEAALYDKVGEDWVDD